MSRPVPIAGPQASLTATQRESLRALLGAIVPRSADGRMPGANEMAELIRDIASARPALAALGEQLDTLESAARAGFGLAFTALDEARRVSLLDGELGRNPALRQLILQIVTGYYQRDSVLEALGMEARPPFPKGYAVDAGDLSLLDPVIARGRIFREAP